MNELRILGIKIDNLSKEEIDNWLKKIIDGPPEKKFVATVNPEIILQGHRDRVYGDILNSSDLNVCDGFGIRLVSWFKGKGVKGRYTGVALTNFLLKLAKEKSQKVLVIAREDSLSKPLEIEKMLELKYELEGSALYRNESNLFESEKTKNAQIVFVNFGAPEQEMYIFENRKYFPSAVILVGVGGAFDFLTGKMKRAPKWMRKIGFEWLFRLFQEPKRIKRIWNAVFVFPFCAIFDPKQKCQNKD